MKEIDKLKDLLNNTELNNNQKIIIIDLFKNGESTVLDIYKRTRIHRSNIYDDLRELIYFDILSQKLYPNKSIFLINKNSKYFDNKIRDLKYLKELFLNWRK